MMAIRWHMSACGTHGQSMYHLPVWHSNPFSLTKDASDPSLSLLPQKITNDMAGDGNQSK